jgi:hypothetical protein
MTRQAVSWCGALALAVSGCVRAPSTATRFLAERDPRVARPIVAGAETYPFQAPLPSGPLPRSSPAVRDANLSPTACRAELQTRKLHVRRAGTPSPGVATPLRIEGEIGGVRFVTPRAPSPYGVLDCRLVIALDDLAKLLARHDVVTVYVDNLYRPHAHLPGKRKPSQHAYGLAIDLTGFKLADGTQLFVGRDWHGAIGRPTCGPDSSPLEINQASVELRNILCDVARAGIFQHMLTPNFNRAHKSHFHFDLARGVTYRFVR